MATETVTTTIKQRGVVYRFFRFIWRSLRAIQTVFFGLILLFIVVAAISAAAGNKGSSVPNGSALVINPSGVLVEQQTAQNTAASLLNDDLPQEALVQDIIDALALAKEDETIGLVVLSLSNLRGALPPKLEVIANAITDFKTSDKQVIAVANHYSQAALYLAAHADEVLMNPEGYAVPEGYAMYMPFFKTLLDNTDVTVNTFKVGRYKSAVDPYSRDSMSDEDKEARLGILNTWWEAYTSTVEAQRGLDADSIDAMLQNSVVEVGNAHGDLAQLALEKGFVDRLVTNPERRAYLIELAGENEDKDNFSGIAYRKYLRKSKGFASPLKKTKGDKIAVITAVGAIVDGTAPAGGIGGRSLSRLIRDAHLDEDVKAIVLRIDSGGGSAVASENILTELEAVQADGIPLVVSMGSLAASGGYWIASSADEIWASPTTVTGSIGIYALMPTFEKTLERYGVFTDGVATTPIAGGLSAIRGVAPEYGEALQLTVEAGYDHFLQTVADGRNMDVDAVHEIAQGRIWTGAKAQELGLVDELGHLDDAIESAAELAKLENYSVWHVKPELSFEEELIQKLRGVVFSAMPNIRKDPLSQVAAHVRKELDFLRSLNDPKHTYVICGNCPTD